MRGVRLSDWNDLYLIRVEVSDILTWGALDAMPESGCGAFADIFENGDMII